METQLKTLNPFPPSKSFHPHKLINKGWEVQHKIETKTNVFIKRIGKRFIVGLFSFSVIVYGFFEIFYYYFFFDYGFVNRNTGFIHQMDSLTVFFNPVYHLFCGFVVFVIVFVTKQAKVK